MAERDYAAVTSAKYEQSKEVLSTFKWTKWGKMVPFAGVYRNKDLDSFKAMAEQEEESFNYVEEGYVQPVNYNDNGFFDMSVAGLYFAITLNKGAMPDNSPYGKYRVVVPVERIFDGETGTFYFLNSYMVRENLYFVLVYVNDLQSQSADTLAMLAKLVQLDNNNSIIKYDAGSWKYRQGIWLEVLVVGDLNIEDLPKDNCKAITGTVTGKNMY